MKKYLLLTILVYANALPLIAQTDSSLISIKLKNTSLLPKRVAVISYTPGEGGNGTQIFSIMPGSHKQLEFKTGTKIYLANSQQTDSVMSGKRIDNGQPFLVVKSTDNQKTFQLK